MCSVCKGPKSVVKRPTLSEVLHAERAAVQAASTGAARLEAIRQHSRKRKAEVTRRMCEDFATKALRAPRGDRPKKVAAAALECEGRLTSDVANIEAAFRSLYTRLFTDPANGHEEQSARLSRLRDLGKCESRIVVPVWLVKECLVKQRLKHK